MPQIKITEVDTSTAGVSDVTTNAVYVPGYAITGPVNQPTLCNTLEEFKSIFGDSPYVYRGNHLASDAGSFASIPWEVVAGQHEMSYVFASDLLRLGLPILYERMDAVAPSGQSWYGSYDIRVNIGTVEVPNIVTVAVVKSTYPGLASEKIWFTLDKKTISVPSQTAGGSPTDEIGYTLTVGRYEDVTLKISAISPVNTYFTLSSKLNNYQKIWKKVSAGDTLTDSSGLVTFKINSGVTSLPKVPEPPVTTIPTLTVTVTNKTTTDEFTPSVLFNYLSNESNTEKLTDKGEYVFKFITAGAYPSMNAVSGSTYYTIAENLLKVASARGDLTAVLDFYQDESTNYSTVRSNIDTWVSALGNNARGEEHGIYGGVPVCKNLVFNSPTTNEEEILSPAFAWLSAFANSVITNANWYACAGVTRGVIPNLKSTDTGVSNALAEALQPRNAVSLIPIINVKPYGIRVWGNRTLKNNFLEGDLTASSFMNIRQLANDVKRTIWVASRRCTFDQNNNILWINFKAQITPLLDQMVGNNGLSNYKIVRLATDKKATLVARVTLYCVEAVEDFDITVELTDSQITLIQ